ncbi:Phosphopantetheine adenylyltransferase [hydrothermal vent metagenome]|uniref:Phosphopantetheine adenylyltransferase n=1 Tax=hydrothermal vent metagenome TaxID=652676 RepID=A0A3B1C0X3_9ZZZZ
MKAVYPGTFDPVTYGHIDLMRRGTEVFSELVVAVAANPRKNPMFSLETRVNFVAEATADISNITIIPFETLLVDFAREIGAKVILKGLRAISDFEHELQMSLINRRLAPDVETVFMMPSEEFSYISSSLIKEIASLGGNTGEMTTKQVGELLKERLTK